VAERSPYTSKIQYVPTTRMITLFSDGRKPEPGQRVVYIDGAFDLFHYGHVEALRQAKALGDFLVVGIYEEDVVRRLNRTSVQIPIQTVR
jgi:ethanolamine-phosphate cytidylyltransferase